MKLIKPNVEIIEQLSGLDNMLKHIEKAGRTCYKSEDKITEDSAKKFVDMLANHRHGAMLEHGTIYLTIPEKLGYIDIIEQYVHNKYSNVNDVLTEHGRIYYITTNYRVIIENNWERDLVFMTIPTEYHAKRITVKFTLDQGVMREFTRHRVFSFACESTRYCNYCTDKFNNEVTFIIPSWCENIKDGSYVEKNLDFEIDTKYTTNEQIFLKSLNMAENAYFGLSIIWKPQQVRAILPLATKCELIMTGFIDDWKHFLSLRSSDYGATGAHPDASYIANKLYAKLREENYLS